jgi:DNA-binding MarR family transcriptional regulator
MANQIRSPLQAEIVAQLRCFSAGVILFNQKVAERVGLLPTDVQCMNLLDLLGTCTPGRLAEGMSLTTGGVTCMLDRLEKAGFIKREPNPDDRRSVLIRVSAKKKEKIDVHYAGIMKQFDAYISEISDAELEIVTSFFKQVNAIRMNAAIVADSLDARP